MSDGLFQDLQRLSLYSYSLPVSLCDKVIKRGGTMLEEGVAEAPPNKEASRRCDAAGKSTEFL